MRRVLFLMLAAAALSGCVSMFDNAYDEQARTQCEQESGPRDRGGCLDRVDENRRGRE